MLNYFPSIGSKGKDVKGLIENSAKLLGRDKDIFRPVVYITMFKSIPTLIIFYVIYQAVIVKDYEKIPLILLSLFAIIPIISFISMRYKAIMCSMVFDILRGKDTDIPFASRRIKGRGLTLFLYSIVDMIIKSATNTKSRNKNIILSLLTSLLLGIFKEVWDLVKNFSLPAIVIDKASISDVPRQLKKVKKNIPAALVGILGLDIIGGILISLFGFIQLPALLLSGLMGYYLVDFFPKKWLFTDTVDQGFAINLLPIFIFLFMSTVFTSFCNSLVQLVKTSYFTTFYISLSRPQDIREELREDVTNYLNYKEHLNGYTFFERKEEEAYDLDVETNEDLKTLRKLAATFKKNIEKGISRERITEALVNKAYSQDVIDRAFDLYKSSK